MTQFENAHQVRAFLKDKGFEMKGTKVRFVHNPFGGRGLFFVEPPMKDGEVYFTACSSTGPTVYSDKLRTDIAKALEGTNARAS